MSSASPVGSVAGVVHNLIPQDGGSGLEDSATPIYSATDDPLLPNVVPPPVVEDTSSEALAATLKELKDSNTT